MCTPHLVLGGSGPGDINRFLLILLLARMAVNTWLKQNLSWCRWRQQQHRCYPAAHTFLKLIPLDILSKPSKACNFSEKIETHPVLVRKKPKTSHPYWVYIFMTWAVPSQSSVCQLEKEIGIIVDLTISDLIFYRNVHILQTWDYLKMLKIMVR